MLVELKDLKKGDEIMLAQGCKFVYARVLREPSLRFVKVDGVKVPKLQNWGSHKGEQLYSTMKCEVKTKTRIEPPYYSGGKPRTIVEFDNTREDYNDTKYFNLNFRDIWLIEK